MVKRDDLPEFCGQVIDEFEDFLEHRHVLLPNSERDENPEAAIIYGSDYDDLCASVIHILDGWGLLEKEIGDRGQMVERMAKDYGSLDLLTAYIMRTAGVTEDQAADVVHQIDFDTERWLDELFKKNKEEEACEPDM